MLGWPGSSGSSWRTSSPCPSMCLSAASRRYCRPSPQTFPSGAPLVRHRHRLRWVTEVLPSVGERHGVVTLRAGLPVLTCCVSWGGPHPLWTTPGGTSSSPSSRGFPDVGSRWQETSQSPRPLPERRLRLGLQRLFGSQWLDSGWERKGRRHAGPGRHSQGWKVGVASAHPAPGR